MARPKPKIAPVVSTNAPVGQDLVCILSLVYTKEKNSILVQDPLTL